MALIVVCIVVFALGAVLGVRNFVRRLSTGGPSRELGYLHGVISTASLALLVIYSILHPAAVPNWAFRLFVIAAIAGFVLFGIASVGMVVAEQTPLYIPPRKRMFCNRGAVQTARFRKKLGHLARFVVHSAAGSRL